MINSKNIARRDFLTLTFVSKVDNASVDDVDSSEAWEDTDVESPSSSSS